MSTKLDSRETEYGRICLTEFSGGTERGVMVQVDGPNVHMNEAHWITLCPDDAGWVGMCLIAWAVECNRREVLREQGQ
jgi:hypothetical protein